MSLISEVQLLTADECEKALASINKLKPFWTQRAKKFNVPFFSLGTATYMDAKKDYDAFVKRSKQSNVYLKDCFGWVYDKLLAALEKELGVPAVLTERFTLPGFHIFQFSKVFEAPVASLHCDLQYELLDWEGSLDADPKPISFTLSLKLPSHGGGLLVWDLKHEDTQGMSLDEKNAKLAAAEQGTCEYKEGGLVIHSGHMYHQIAPFRDAQPGDERITLQGHGVLVDGRYEIYW